MTAVKVLLAEGGVPAARAGWAVDVLLLLATATAAEQSARDRTDKADEEALVAAVAEALHPHLAWVGDELFSGTGPQRLGWTFRALLSGTLHTPRP
ncbi:hypothetical protein [Actinomadura atramentaria]|uniref:hypothetical protein n=1 Tax=Actinomadura atramentaria TaxID=1990 RepID=UPI0003A65C0B|nr:hypothetical protein [Actinomadura atramentaria]